MAPNSQILSAPSAEDKNVKVPAASSGKELKDEKVQLDKKTVEAILAKVETLSEQVGSLADENKKKDKQIEMLTEVADKGRLARYEEQNNGGELIRTAKVAFWRDLPIIGWKNVKDEVGFRDGRLIVNQITKLYLDQGKESPLEEDVEFLYWVQNVQSKIGEVVERSENSNGAQFVTVQLKDGRKLKLDIRFINAF